MSERHLQLGMLENTEFYIIQSDPITMRRGAQSR
jgi:hypothetical protein